MNICICGGGNLGTVCAGYLAARGCVNVNIYTRQPERWSRQISVSVPEGKTFKGTIKRISNRAEIVIPESEIVLLCLPGFAIEETLRAIKPYLRPQTLVGSIVSSTGFFFMAHEVLKQDYPLFGFQRVPFIARSTEYGKSADLLGYKKQLAIAAEFTEEEKVRKLVETLFDTPTILLNNFYEASLTNSNPILHTGRLYSMWKEWDGLPYDKPIFFYKEWTDEASEIIIEMDNEFQRLLRTMGIAESTIPPLLTYYESSDISSLTRKIKSIPAFSNILAPMKEIDGNWYPDFKSRYFTEDFPYGLKHIKVLLQTYSIDSKTIDLVFFWGIKMINNNSN